MELDEMYKYTHDTKWVPFLERINEGESVLDLRDEFTSLCVFCEDSQKGVKRSYDCEMCRIDHTICDMETENYSHSLFYRLLVALDCDDEATAEGLVEDIVAALENHY